jgi:uncharacterized membrane protein
MTNNNTISSSPLITGSLSLRAGLIISYLCVFGLLATYAVNAIITDKLASIIFILPCLTLLIFVPGMWQHKHRTYNWMCFVILLHFTVAVTHVMSPLIDMFDILQLIFSSVLFLSAMMTSRWLQYWSLEHR